MVVEYVACVGVRCSCIHKTYMYMHVCIYILSSLHRKTSSCQYMHSSVVPGFFTYILYLHITVL